jgi:hypothetical protein
MTLDAVRADLEDIVARIEGTFEDEEASSHYALEQTRDRLVALLRVAGSCGMPEPILPTEDGCGACGSHWGWSAWASDADKAQRRRQHAQGCPVARQYPGGTADRERWETSADYRRGYQDWPFLALSGVGNSDVARFASSQDYRDGAQARRTAANNAELLGSPE